jgi:hypothetical protein
MAVISEALTALPMVKARLSITANTYDALLESYINRASALIKDYWGFSLKRQERIEQYKPTNSQWLILNYYPIQTISYIKYQGTALVADTDYSTASQDWQCGRVYKDTFWTGTQYTMGVSYVPVASIRGYEVKYIAGYYLPMDVGYVEGEESSLPLGICNVCELIVSNTFRIENERRQGLAGTSQGGISYTYLDGSRGTHAFSTGLDEVIAGQLNNILAKRMLCA